jgi:hypothetical protein
VREKSLLSSYLTCSHCNILTVYIPCIYLFHLVTRQGTMADYANYPLLCEAIRKAFIESGHPDWLITIATTINPSKLSKGYDLIAMYPHVDFFNIMAYGE